MAVKRKKIKGGAGTKKYYKNETKCQYYKADRRWEKSHIKRLKKHIGYNPNDRMAAGHLERFEGLLRG